MKVITAIGNPYINENLNNFYDYEIIGKDIQYQEGIIEVLEEKKDINLLILSNNLPEEYDFYILINKVLKLNENIEIIVFLKEKNQDIENFLNSKKIYKIYYLDEFSYNKFFENLKLKNYKEKLSKEILELKNIISESTAEREVISKINNIGNVFKKDKNIIKKYNKVELNKSVRNFKKSIHNKYTNCQTIVITGVHGVGKSMISTILAKCIDKKDKKVLLIDFDIFNNSINTILGINKYPKNINKLDIESFIININKNFSVLCGLDLLFKDLNNNFNNEIKLNEIRDILKILKENYEFIIIDISSNIKYKYVRLVLSSGDKIIFLIEPNVLEIKKAHSLLEIYINDWEIDIDKIKILFNKTNKYEIAGCVLEEIFSDFDIVGNIEYDEKYSLMINKNMTNFFYKNEYEKIYENIKK